MILVFNINLSLNPYKKSHYIYKSTHIASTSKF